MRTYGQIVDGKTLTCKEFIKSVQTNLEMAIGKSAAPEKIKNFITKAIQ